MTIASTRRLHLTRWAADDIRARPDGSRPYADPGGDGREREYTQDVWDSPTATLDTEVESVVVSWVARTPGRTWVEVAVRGGAAAADGDWLVVGRWAETGRAIHRTSVPDQKAAGARVATDEVLVDADAHWRQVQVRVTLLRPAGETADAPDGETAEVHSATVRSVSLLLSGAPGTADTAAALHTGTSTDGTATGLPATVLVEVPAYSQQLHRELPEAPAGGGRNWCSPTSVTMVVDHWAGRTDGGGGVPETAGAVFDAAFDGTGNWPFNTAHAGTRGLDAFVTRLRSLDEAAAFLRAGIPLVLGVAFADEELEGAGYDTDGHLLVLVGMDAAGDVVVNDPASHGVASDDEVRTTYRRDQLARAWLERASGIAYVIRPTDVPLPAAPPGAAW